MKHEGTYYELVFSVLMNIENLILIVSRNSCILNV